ncbi:MAG TPA: glutamate-1-semialdehyde 2,1-aminomutase, partial [Methylocella sp.]|nr:glutamate-1-semialdehyde 2,1-aminomutase [Methylocella sp.]
MESRITLFALSALGAGVLIASLAKLKTRLELSKAKHRSLAGHSRMARRVASLIPFYEYDEAHFFCSDGAPDDIAARREAGFARLSKLYRDRFAETNQLTAKVKEGISDLQFTEAYRVPFQFSRLVREHLTVGAFVQSSSGVTLT